MDFSVAQREGFIQAFVEYWRTTKPGSRTIMQLEEDARKLVKGCEYHFHQSVERISKIIPTTDSHPRREFVQRMKALANEDSVTIFKEELEAIRRTWTGADGWFDWWLRPNTAKMIFASLRTMDQDLSEALPNTTNAEESMHWRLYRAVGSKNTFLSGIEGLVAVANLMERQNDAIKGQIEPLYYFKCLLYAK